MLATTLVPATAFAGEQTRAEAAIAEAKGKIEAADRVGVGEQAPGLQAQAREALMSAQDLLSHHKKTEAIAAAQQAGMLADRAIVVAHDRKTASDRDRRTDMRDAGVRAQQSADSANTRATIAEAATDSANHRADDAERATAAATAETNAMRAAPPPPPMAMPTSTTVAITEHDSTDRAMAVPAAAHRKMTHPIVRRHPVRRTARHHLRTHHVKTTTITTTSHN
jgi:hypothetical protein